MITYSTDQLYAADPRVLDVLLRHWRHASLHYPLSSQPHHHHHHHHHHCSDDVGDVVLLRERSLGLAVSFMTAVRRNTLQCLNSLHLTVIYTGRSVGLVSKTK